MMDERAEAYVRHWSAQQHGGSSFPVFRGSRHMAYQEGAGIGDILRGIFRFLAPVALRGLSSFAGNTLRAHQKGATLGEAAKSSILPALGDAAQGVMERFSQPGQEGGGKRKRRAGGRATGGSKKKRQRRGKAKTSTAGGYKKRRQPGGEKSKRKSAAKNQRRKKPVKRSLKGGNKKKRSVKGRGNKGKSSPATVKRHASDSSAFNF